MIDPFHLVDDAAARGGTIFGVPDYLPQHRQLEIALSQTAALHEEVARLIRVGNAAIAALSESTFAEPTIRERLASAWRRRKRLGPVGLCRTVAWILIKSKRENTRSARALRSATRSNALKSRYIGDKPIRDMFSNGQFDEAHVMVRSLLPRHSANHRFLTLARDIEVQRGSISAALAITRRIAEQCPVAPESIRQIEGRIREVSGWHPRIPGPRRPLPNVDEKKILHLVKESRPFHSNGFTTRSHKNFLAERAVGLDPVVLTEPGFPRNDGFDDFSRIDHVDGIEHRRLDLGHYSELKMPIDRWLQEYADLAYAEMQNILPAVLHVSSGRRGYETMLVGLALKEKTGIPLVYEFRSFFESTWTSNQAYAERGENFQRRRAVEAMCLDAADIVITLGAAMRDELINMGCREDKIVIIPNGADIELFSPRPRSTALCTQLGIDDLPTFGYVSNMDHLREGQETLIEAAAVLKARGRDFKCLLVGGGARREVLERLANERGVAQNIVFTGPVDHGSIEEYYGLIDVFVVPRADERAARLVTPLKPFEAMAMAKPIVVSGLPALEEIVDPPTRGLSFPVGDSEELASQIEVLFESDELRHEMGKAGLEWLTANRQWYMNGTRYMDAYSQAAGSGS
ncbi:glycosyltransferase family 4 protein [Isoptericola croceus]|uniref:glycosyltransferase family 4 protein n=1 Tax=Isoptericola croceus TaxID=3031406 RepID=UPI0023F73915|nr:glycosyltransferase family 4 protein [Isoptericola croceus]